MNTNDIRKKIEKLIPKGRLYHCERYEKAALKEALTLIPKDHICVPKKDLLTEREIDVLGRSWSYTIHEFEEALKKLKALSKDSRS